MIDTNTIGLLIVAALNAYTAFLVWQAKRSSADNSIAIAKTDIKIDDLHTSVNGRLTQLLASKAETTSAQVAAAHGEGIEVGRKLEEDRTKVDIS